ncbi:MAG: hypothetical protein ABI768_14005 [Acidobacteriota bacterium]
MNKARVLISLLVLGIPAVASAQSREALNNSWGGYHWARTTNSFTVKLQENLTSDWTGYLTTASSDWSQSAVLDTTIVAGSTSSNARRKCSMVAGRVVVCNTAYGRNGWLGLASINITGGTHITQGSVKVNDSYTMNTAEKLHVMCQEVGHTFGLDHQSTSGASLNTCMDYYSNTSNSDTVSTHPNTHDYEELGIIYSHLDNTNTSFLTAGTETSGAGRIPAMNQIDLDGPGQWGVEVERSEDGRFSTFVLDFGAGNQTVTFVTWAADAKDEDGNPRFDRGVRSQ